MNKQEIKKAIEILNGKIGYCKDELEFGLGEDVDQITISEIKTFEMAISALQQQLNNGWIPCKERLPEDRYYPPVICCNTVDGWTDAAAISGRGYFVNCEGVIIHPTHWQPLPEPYKEVSE